MKISTFSMTFFALAGSALAQEAPKPLDLVSLSVDSPYIHELKIEVGAVRGCRTGCSVSYTVNSSGQNDYSKYLRIRLQVDIGGLCEKHPRQWSVQKDFSNVGQNGFLAFPGDAACDIYLARATVLSVVAHSDQGDDVLVRRENPPPIDFTERLTTIEQNLEIATTKEKAEAAKEKAAAEIAAKRERQRAAAERKELEAWEAKRAAEKAAEQQRARENCRKLFEQTVNVKVKDLTVGQEQEVRACQILGLYPPY